MPVFVTLVIITAILLWFLLAKCFEGIGDLSIKLAKPFTKLNTEKANKENTERKDDKNEKQ